MPKQSALDMKVSKVYPLLVAKVQRKGRTKEEVDEAIAWLTGHNMQEVDQEMTYADFLGNAPHIIRGRSDLLRAQVREGFYLPQRRGLLLRRPRLSLHAGAGVTEQLAA